MSLSNIFFHAAILIPIEFGLLHATPLGGMLVESFTGLFDAIGWDFGESAHALHDHGASAVAATQEPIASTAANLTGNLTEPASFASAGTPTAAVEHFPGDGHNHGLNFAPHLEALHHH